MRNATEREKDFVIQLLLVGSTIVLLFGVLNQSNTNSNLLPTDVRFENISPVLDLPNFTIEN
jgi:hypothetical protein